MPDLYLKCKTCGAKFQSGIVMEKRGLESIKLIDNQHTCPKGHIHTTRKTTSTKGSLIHYRRARNFEVNENC